MPKNEEIRKPTATAPAPVSNKNGIDTSVKLSALPEGFDVNEFQETGGLTPIYSQKDAFENRFPPIVGFMKCIEALPVQYANTDNEFTPIMIRFVLTAPTKAIVGKDDKREIVDVGVGGEVLLPVTGNLRVNGKVIAAANNPTHYFLAQAIVTGQTKLKAPTPMWDMNVKLHPKASLREGTPFARMTTGGSAMLETADGSLYNVATGEIVSNGPARALPPQASAAS